MDLAAALTGAAGGGELIAYFQPQVDLASGRVVAVESLCRWQHPEWGMVSPVDFIPVAEESGAIHGIGDFMAEECCRFAAATPDLEVAINVSAVQLAYPDFSTRLVQTWERFGLPASRFTIELTESRPVLDIPDAVTQLERLRDLGADISIDDFGVGFSSRKQLDDLPFTELKLDQSLIREDTEETWTRVASVVAISRGRGMRIVAEGVESAEQYESVRAADCDRAQGFHIARPLPRDEFAAWLRANSRTPLPALAAPVRRALEGAGIRNLEDAAARGRTVIGSLHGVGPKAVATLRSAMDAAGVAHEWPATSR